MPEMTIVPPRTIQIALIASPISPRDGTVVWRLVAEFTGRPDNPENRQRLEYEVSHGLLRWELRWRGAAAVLYPPRDPRVPMLVEYPPIDEAMIARALAAWQSNIDVRTMVARMLEAALPNTRNTTTQNGG